MMLADFLLDFDVFVEVFSLVIALAIAGFSFRSFFLTKERRYGYFGLAFLSIALGITLSALFNTYIQFEDLHVLMRGYLHVSYLLGILWLLSVLFVLTGFMTIFIINELITNKKNIFFLYMLVLFSVLVSHDFYFLYHLTALMLMLFLFAHALKNYKEKRSASSQLVMCAFASLFVSEALLVLTFEQYLFYIAGNVFRLIGFAFLLVTLILIYRKK